ncbi:hypothetical protein [Actinomadura opuntiae]|uniref:hypothetical protein n=1 Tax=Actinomadura sp. OS1-43 TaxID=604315 RepID=UPI00255AD7F1|nr:hypothetical protein [Actinomadura sp. OS1-43]MDL4817076.1 hypothetical protein [Actinomadura sp. OS1-43]
MTTTEPEHTRGRPCAGGARSSAAGALQVIEQEEVIGPVGAAVRHDGGDAAPAIAHGGSGHGRGHGPALAGGSAARPLPF